MLFKFVIVLLSSVLQTAVLAGASSTRIGQNAQEHPIKIKRGTTNFVRRKMKEEKVRSEKSNDKEEEDDESIDSSIQEVIEEELSTAAIDYGETADEDAVPSFTPDLPSFALADDSWNHGSYAVSSAKSGTVKIYVPDDTQVGDTLFLFLR